MAQAIRVLAIHGIGHQEARKPQWQPHWENTISEGIRSWAPSATVEVAFFDYDDLFGAAPMNPLVVGKAMKELFGGLLVHGIGDLFRRGRGIGDWLGRQRWGAGMVAQWASDAGLRRKLRARLAKAMRDFAPDVVCAHSLGSLLAYDGFVWPGNGIPMAGRTFVSFGSQIGFPAVRGIYGGFLRPIPCTMWYHLYNPRDDVFTAPIRLSDQRFAEIIAEFEVPGIGDHDGIRYLGHAVTLENVWRYVAGAPDATRAPARRKPRPAAKPRRPDRRALLVGINEYPDAADRLDGCVNDAFLVSSAIQECGFAAEEIRLVTDARATARGIRGRLEWLLDGAADGDQRVFFYAGHGSQLAGYGIGETIDRLDECLVPSAGARRIGSGVTARSLRDPEYDRVRKELGHLGPYWPLLLFACGEQEFAGEYQHGPIAYGAFTFALVKTLRDRGKAGKRVSFGRLVDDTARLLRGPDLAFDQTPHAYGPAEKLKAAVPWLGASGA